MAAPARPRDRIRREGARAFAVASDLAQRAAIHLRESDGGASLTGDRWVEWSFCEARLAEGEGTTLDFGADIGFLSLSAAQRGHEVVALDRMPPRLDYEHPRVAHHRADILERPLAGRRFDQIINCSSVEHVGLAGRYESTHVPDGDLEAMGIMASMLAPGGRMILTVPVGRDMVCAPRHRVYGSERLPRLISEYDALEEQYWVKEAGRWVERDRATALATEGSDAFYSLGLFVLGHRRP